jgi:hypothetical protein
MDGAVISWQDIIDKKASAAAKKTQKEIEKVERQIATTNKRRLAAEVRAQKAAERQAQKELRALVNKDKKQQQKVQRQSIGVL